MSHPISFPFELDRSQNSLSSASVTAAAAAAATAAQRRIAIEHLGRTLNAPSVASC